MIVAIPDIHGMSSQLDTLMTKLYDEWALDLKKDKLIFLGDMIDRGPDSKGVLDRIMKLQEDYPNNVVALYGNHEDFMVRALVHGDLIAWSDWNYNGGIETMASFGTKKVPQHYLEWLARLPRSHQEEGFFFSHAPVPEESYRSRLNKGQPFTDDELIWSYFPKEAPAARKFPDKIGVCGHVHALRKGVIEPRFYDHYIFADAGCGCSGKAPLVAINVETRHVLYSYKI